MALELVAGSVLAAVVQVNQHAPDVSNSFSP
jgi:hypothetical protein